MCGKLQYYYYKKDGIWEEDKLSSEGLSEIQIEECFKKHIFISLCRVSTRLNYFFNFGSQNAVQFDENNEQKFDGDIFLEREKRNQFYAKIKENTKEFEDLRSKMAT